MTRHMIVEIRLGPDAVRDEHLAVDADRCEDGRWLHAADVLYGSTLRSPGLAEGWLRDVMDRRPACTVAATPVAGGRWAARCRPHGRVLYVAAPPHAPVGSCLHAWLVAGRNPEELAGTWRRGEVADGMCFTVRAGSPRPAWRVRPA